jgi:hypothetical protein
MLDSPIGVCPVCRHPVLLDQTPKECAREHECSEPHCPLESAFTGIEFREGAKGMPARPSSGKPTRDNASSLRD